jgi:hypothetical protein
VTNWTDIASFATAGGTVLLAVATFSAVRFGSRSARATERALLAGLLPVLVPSRLHDPAEKIRFIDDHWIEVSGGHANLEVGRDVIYLAVALRNVGQGLAMLDRWDLDSEENVSEAHREIAAFRRLTRDLYVPGGDLGFWQGTIRDTSDAKFADIKEAITARHALVLDLLYGDHEGGQRTVSRFWLTPRGETEWLASASRHWKVDGPDPR